jgi:exosortase A-associated hydrolase 2
LIHNTSPTAEKIFFFPGSGGRRLLGFLHYAETRTASTGIIYCHPFTEEKNMSHSVVVKAARAFAAAGFPVFRFDFSGCGDSEGDMQFTSMEDWKQDLDAAIEIFRKETGVSQCLLWGLRLGAGIALMRQQYDNNNIAGLILWQPVLDFSVHIRQFLRRAISAQISNDDGRNAGSSIEHDLQKYGLTHVIGYPVTRELYDSFNQSDGQPAGVVPSVPTLLLSISLMDEPVNEINRYAERLRKAETPMILKHVKAEPFWDRYWQWECNFPIEVTLCWLRDMI